MSGITKGRFYKWYGLLSLVSCCLLYIARVSSRPSKLTSCHAFTMHLTGTLSSIGGNGGTNVFGVIRSIVPFRLIGSTKGNTG